MGAASSSSRSQASVHDFAPSFSPAGDQITFERDAGDFSTFAVWVMNVDGTA